MKIELDDLKECEKCGCIYNFRLCIKGNVTTETDYRQTKIYDCICPCCKHIKKIWDV